MCGIIAVAGVPDPSRAAYLGLYSLQHRGQEPAAVLAARGPRRQRPLRGLGPAAPRSAGISPGVARQARRWIRRRIGDVRARPDRRDDGAGARAWRVFADPGLAARSRQAAVAASQASSTLHL